MEIFEDSVEAWRSGECDFVPFAEVRPFHFIGFPRVA